MVLTKNPANIPFTTIEAIQFYVLDSEDNETDGTVIVANDSTTTMSGGINTPVGSGIYDTNMGTTDDNIKCTTCKNGKKLCPGHYGKIPLNYPIVSPMFVGELLKWLKIICIKCGHMVVPVTKFKVKSDKWLSEYVKNRRANGPGKVVKCPSCDTEHPKIKKDASMNFKFWIYRGEEPEYLYPHLIKEILERVTDETVRICGRDPKLAHPRRLIWSILRVPPNAIRPDIKRGGSDKKGGTSDISVVLKQIVKYNAALNGFKKDSIDKNTATNISLLNMAAYDMIKGSSSPNKTSLTSGSGKSIISIAKRLPRKVGRIRRNLMGRRVNYVGRSFITCDPYLRNDEVGIPMYICRTITIPVVVQAYNYDECLMYFNNSRTNYPGCQKIKHGNKVYTKKDSLEIGDVIYRDVITGDIVNFNRQPSLLPSNITAMKVIAIDKGNTIRMNVLVCSWFNADFDGDAMNLQFARSSRTINEIEMLNGAEQMFISYKDAKPTIGSAQDALIGLFELTSNSTKLDKAHAMRLFRRLDVNIDFGSYPAGHVFSGRDIITMYLVGTGRLINFRRVPSFYNSVHASYRSYDPLDIEVRIDKGVHISGVLDKASIGEEAAGGIFHIIHNQYGAKSALDAAFDLQQIGIAFLYNRGVTMSMQDILLSDHAMDEIHKIERSLIQESEDITRRLNDGRIIPPIGKTITEYYEDMQLNALNPGDKFWPHILGSIDHEHNCLYRVIVCGARGKLTNLKSISSAVGQIEINAERVKENFGGRASPYYTRYDSDPASRGYIANSYISGMTAPEFYFHSQDARYLLIQRALSTAITGHKGREGIKSTEGMTLDNQRKVVNGNKVVQPLYGFDGIDPRKLEKVTLITMKEGVSDEEFASRFRVTDFTVFGKAGATGPVKQLCDEEFAQLVRDRHMYQDMFMRMESTASARYVDTMQLPVQIARIIDDVLLNEGIREYVPGSLNPTTTIESVRELCTTLDIHLMNADTAVIPHHVDCANLTLKMLLRSHLCLRNLITKGVNDKALADIIARATQTYLNALCDYGKSVGILSAQSIAQPMTQQVIDSHHSSGLGGTKKKGLYRIAETLGVKIQDRMREPSMSLQIVAPHNRNKLKVQEIANTLDEISLNNFLVSWNIFYEEVGKPSHPNYVSESRIFNDFIKMNSDIKVPGDLTRWCIRIELDKAKLIEKRITMDIIYRQIKKAYEDFFIVYTNENAPRIIMRIYMKAAISRKNELNIANVGLMVEELRRIVIRGVPGIRSAVVNENEICVRREDGAMEREKIYSIYTSGSNLKKVFENPYIDPYTSVSDCLPEVNKMFGISATRNRIIAELKYLVQDISIRHYAIYADEMTFAGVPTSIDRYGSAKRENNVLLRISDAAPLDVIEQAALCSAKEKVTGVSPCIMLGKNPNVGDLFNKFYVDTKFVAKQLKKAPAAIDIE